MSTLSFPNLEQIQSSLTTVAKTYIQQCGSLYTKPKVISTAYQYEIQHLELLALLRTTLKYESWLQDSYLIDTFTKELELTALPIAALLRGWLELDTYFTLRSLDTGLPERINARVTYGGFREVLYPILKTLEDYFIYGMRGDLLYWMLESKDIYLEYTDLHKTAMVNIANALGVDSTAITTECDSYNWVNLHYGACND